MLVFGLCDHRGVRVICIAVGKPCQWSKFLRDVKCEYIFPLLEIRGHHSISMSTL